MSRTGAPCLLRTATVQSIAAYDPSTYEEMLKEAFAEPQEVTFLELLYLGSPRSELSLVTGRAKAYLSRFEPAEMQEGEATEMSLQFRLEDK